MAFTCDLIVAVWGTEFRQYLVNYCLPSLLAPDNLPLWCGIVRSRLVIYTLPQDAAWLQAQPLLSRVSQQLEVVYQPLDTAHLNNRYDTINLCHQHAIRQACQYQQSLIFLSPDNIYAEGTLATILQASHKGHSGVLHFSPILNLEDVVQALPPCDLAGALILSRTTVLQLVMRHMHYRTWIYSWNLDVLPQPSACLYWQQERQCVIHAYHWHPLWLAQPQPMDLQQQPRETIDGLYLQQYNDQREQFYLVQTQELMAFSLQSAWQRPVPDPLHDYYFKQRACLDLADQQFTSIHKWLFEHPIIWPLPSLEPPSPLAQRQSADSPQQVEAMVCLSTLTRLADEQAWEQLWQYWQIHRQQLQRVAPPDLLWLVWGYTLHALATMGSDEALSLEKQHFYDYFMMRYPQWLQALPSRST